MTDYCEGGCDILGEDLLHAMPGLRVVAGARVALLLASLPLLAWLVLSDTSTLQLQVITRDSVRRSHQYPWLQPELFLLGGNKSPV